MQPITRHPALYAPFFSSYPSYQADKGSSRLQEMDVNVTQSKPPPSTTALPQLPSSRLQSSSTVSESSQQRTSPTTASKFALKTPSKIIKPSASPSTTHPLSSPILPTLRSNSTSQAQTLTEGSSTEKEIRRSVSIANFPQPPKVRRTGLDSKYSTATHSLMSEATAQAKDDTRVGSLRIKRLKTKASTDGPGQMYSGGSTLTLLNGSGDGKAISGSSKAGASNDLASLRSPPHSRSSSAQESYSTSATTFEDIDEKKAREEGDISWKDASKRRGSGRREHEGKGNVIVSVRVRPDAGAEKSSSKDWMLDSRQSLVAYRGREGGDYYYGKSVGSHCTISNPTSSASVFRTLH